MPDQRFDLFDEHADDSYPIHSQHQGDSSAKEMQRRILYSVALIVAIILIATTFPPALAATFLVLGLLGLLPSAWRYHVRSHLSEKY